MEFIYRMVNDVDSKMFAHLMENKDAYVERLGERAISGKINELVQGEVAKAENEEDLKGIEELYARIISGKRKRNGWPH